MSEKKKKKKRRKRKMKLWKILLISSIVMKIHCKRIIPAAHPNVIEPVAKIDYGDMSLQFINDFVLLIQLFMTCVPSGALAPMVFDFVRLSCLFNMISTFSLISLNVLNGWDRLDESRAFKTQMRNTFNHWAEDHEKRSWLSGSPNWREIRDWVNVFDIHFDLYVSRYTDMERNNKINRVICASFGMGEDSLFDLPFEQEICVTKEGIRKLGNNRFSTLSIDTTRELIKFLASGGFIKATNNPPLYLFKLLDTYGDMTIDFLDALQKMTSSIQTESEGFLEKACNFHEDENLLMSIRLKSPHSVPAIMQ